MIEPSYELAEQNIVRGLAEALHGLPHVVVDPPVRESGRDRRIDAEIHFRAADRDFILLVEVKKSVYPREVRDLLWQVKNYAEFVRRREGGATLVPLLAAEALSPGAKELLKNEGVGYFDTGGSLFIPATGAYVYIDKPPPRTLAKSVKVLFRGKRAEVLHALLQKPNTWYSVKALAELAQVSPATVSETLIALDRFDWLETRGQGPSKERRVINPRALLDEWKKQVVAGRPLSVRRFFVRGPDTETLVRHVANVCEAGHLEYAVTQEAAAQMYAPFLSSISRVACRIDAGRDANILAAGLEAREVSEGANLILIDAKQGEGMLFKESVDSVWLASPVQVYLDLLRAGGRSQEMAEHLRHERIGY